MALTFALPANAPSPTPVVRSAALAGLKFRFYRITTDGAYVNGTGYTVTPANFKLDTAIVYLDAGEGLSGFKPVWDSPNQKLRFFKGAAGVDAECANSEGGLNGALFDVMVVGY
jgi:hypothetical protein